MPHCTSSQIMSALFSLVRRRTASIYSWEHGCTPLSPCTASRITAHTSVIGECRLERCDVILRNVDKSARQRLKASCFSGCAVAASVASVRPWKLFVMVTMVEPRYRNASRKTRA